MLALLTLFALWLESLPVQGDWARAGYLNYSAGLTLLFAFALSRLIKPLGLPYITGYLFAGMLAGPYVMQILEPDLVRRLHIVDDLALGIIGLAAGASISWKEMRRLGRSVMLTSILQIGFIFLLLFSFTFFLSFLFSSFAGLSPKEHLALCLVISLLCSAQSPSSAIAVIDECNASGSFTDTVLGVTVMVDIIVICLFPLILSAAHGISAPTGARNGPDFFILLPELGFSLLLGALAGIMLNALMRKTKTDFALFILCFAFGVYKTSDWLGGWSEEQFGILMHPDPLLICMSAGFTVRNLEKTSTVFHDAVHRFSLPVYLLFFSLAGASLRLDALALMWPMAGILCLLRATGLFMGGTMAGMLSNTSKEIRRISFLAHLSKAGVSIGLAQLAARSLPAVGTLITTLVLAVIAVNQVIGPVALKWVLNRAGETEGREET
ncbi:MAG: cation:proton antiporter [Thermodesulfobacteriota bacterium]